MMSTISIFLRSSKVTEKSMVRASRLVARDKVATRRLHSVHACPRRRPSADDAFPHCLVLATEHFVQVWECTLYCTVEMLATAV